MTAAQTSLTHDQAWRAELELARAELDQMLPPIDANSGGAPEKGSGEPRTGYTRDGALTASVVVVTYNRPAELNETLIQLTEQDRKDFEVVVVDGSDSMLTSPALADGFEGLTLRYYRSSVPYLGVVRNLGLLQSRGRVVIYLDDDHYIGTDFVARHVWMHEDTQPWFPCVAVGHCLARPNEPVEWVREATLHTPVGRMLPRVSAGAGNFSSLRQSLLASGGFVPWIRLEGEESELINRMHEDGLNLVNASEVAVVHRCSRTGGTREVQDIAAVYLARRMADRALRKAILWPGALWPVLLVALLLRNLPQLLKLGLSATPKATWKDFICYCLHHMPRLSQRSEYLDVARKAAERGEFE